MDDRPVAVVSGTVGACNGAVVDDLSARFAVWLACHDDFDPRQAVALGVPSSRCWWIDDADQDKRPAELAHVRAFVHCVHTAVDLSASDTPRRHWVDVFDRDLFTVAAVTRRLLPQLRLERGHVIIRYPDSPARSVAGQASEAALRTFAAALRDEERAGGIRVTEIDPRAQGTGPSWREFLAETARH